MSIIKRMLNLLFPPRCMFCREIIDEGYVCGDCEGKLPVNTTKTKAPQFTEKVYAPFYYKNSVRYAIIKFKFKRTPAYAKAFAEYIAKVIKEDDKFRADFITWVPVSKRRCRTRGYDQSKLIAEELSKILDVPLECTLKKIKNNSRQSLMKSEAARRANVVGVYEVLDAEKIFLKRTLLVDDILTTGATVSEAARMLKTAGVSDICVAVIAKTQKK